MIDDSILNLVDDTVENLNSHVSMLDDLDPDHNVVKELVKSNCEYYDEARFCDMVKNNPNLINNFSILHHNIRSIPKNFLSLQEYLDCIDYKFSIIGISETWHNDVTCKMYPLDNYQCLNAYRNNRMGGGVSLYIKK